MRVFKNMTTLCTLHVVEESSSDHSRSWQELICDLKKVIVFLIKMYFSLLLKGVGMKSEAR